MFGILRKTLQVRLDLFGIVRYFVWHAMAVRRFWLYGELGEDVGRGFIGIFIKDVRLTPSAVRKGNI